MDISFGFPPVYEKNARVLILGSLPGVKSILEQRYYAHPRNQFWPIIYSVYGIPVDKDYDKRIRFLLSQKIALWDVCASAYRKGSLDAHIKNETPNDINKLLLDCPDIKLILFNGHKAQQLFKKYFPEINTPSIRLPSTSPITGKNVLSEKEKLSVWRETLLSQGVE